MAALSTGDVAKVGLAQAFGCAPGLLVLGEPWNSLDVVAAAALDRLVLAAATSMAVLVADHTGRMAALPGVRGHELADGTLHPIAAPEPGPGSTTIVLRCPRPAVGDHAHPVPPGALSLGLSAHLAAAATGTAVGSLVAQPLITRIGWSFVLAAVVVTVTAVQPWLPPVGTAVAAITAGGLPWVSGALGVALACSAAMVVGVVESRR